MKERIRYDRNVPAEMLAVIRPHVERCLWLMPPWMQYVNVHFANDDEERPAITTTVNYEYRWATITFYPDWLAADDETRENNVIHEFIHLSSNPIFDYANNTIRVLVGDSDEAKKFYAIEESRLRELHEGMVQDLAQMIQERLER